MSRRTPDELRAEIAVLDAKIAALKKVPGCDRDAAWQQVRMRLRADVRVRRLAIAYLFSRPYQAVETTHIFHGGYPNLYEVVRALTGDAPTFESLHYYGPKLRDWVDATGFGPWPHPALTPRQRRGVASSVHRIPLWHAALIDQAIADVDAHVASGYVATAPPTRGWSWL